MAKTRSTLGGNLCSVGDILQSTLPSLFSSKDALYTTLALQWSSVVGQEISQKTMPLRFVSMKKGGGILYVALLSLDAFFSLSKSQEIIDRVNQYFGYKAVSHITFRQHRKHLQEEKGSKKYGERRSPAYACFSSHPQRTHSFPSELLEEIPSEDLRHALYALALSIYKE